MAKVHEANQKLREMGVDIDDPDRKHAHSRSSSINSEGSSHDDGEPLDGAGDSDDEFA